MRNAFAREITKIAAKKNNLILLSGDIGNRMFDDFKKVAPERFFNCGIAEGNMMSVAAGMALSGMRPVVYTITPFTTIRCLEQIKIGVAYHQAPVVIIGTGSGLSYAELGTTHHSLEDLAVFRSIPKINVLAPADRNELVEQFNQALEDDLPTYIRIGKKGEPILHKKNSVLGIGKANIIKEGEDLLILGIGPILNEAIIAANIYSQTGKSVAVASLGGVQPLDNSFLYEMAKKYSKWISIEEHSVTGGLGSSLIEWLSENNVNNVKIKRLGVPNQFIHELGDQDFVRKKLGLSNEGIVNAIHTII